MTTGTDLAGALHWVTAARQRWAQVLDALSDDAMTLGELWIEADRDPLVAQLKLLPAGFDDLDRLRFIVGDDRDRLLATVESQLWDLIIGIVVEEDLVKVVDRFDLLGLDVVDGVSFSKGCYPGQEIVARTRYLGTVKRTLHRLRLSTPAAPGDPILADPDQSVGTVLRIAAAPEGGFVALAVLDVEAASGALRTATGTVSDVCAIHPPPAV